MKTLKYLLLLLAALAGACTTQAQYAQRVDVVQNAMGYAVPSANVTVCTYSAGSYSLVLGVWTYNGTLPCTSTVTIYADPGGANPITQPVVTNGNGDYAYWVTPGTYTECVAGYQIYTYCVAITIGGSGGIFTSGTIPTTNIQAGTNITFNTSTPGTTIINSTGGSGCALPGNDTAILTEHPALTCYDSAHATWNDASGVNDLKIGDGTISLNADSNSVNKQAFAIGGSNGGTGGRRGGNTALYGSNAVSIGFTKHDWIVGSQGQLR